MYVFEYRRGDSSLILVPGSEAFELIVGRDPRKGSEFTRS